MVKNKADEKYDEIRRYHRYLEDKTRNHKPNPILKTLFYGLQSLDFFFEVLGKDQKFCENYRKSDGLKMMKRMMSEDNLTVLLLSTSDLSETKEINDLEPPIDIKSFFSEAVILLKKYLSKIDSEDEPNNDFSQFFSPEFLDYPDSIEKITGRRKIKYDFGEFVQTFLPSRRYNTFIDYTGKETSVESQKIIEGLIGETNKNLNKDSKDSWNKDFNSTRIKEASLDQTFINLKDVKPRLHETGLKTEDFKRFYEEIIEYFTPTDNISTFGTRTFSLKEERSCKFIRDEYIREKSKRLGGAASAFVEYYALLYKSMLLNVIDEVMLDNEFNMSSGYIFEYVSGFINQVDLSRDDTEYAELLYTIIRYALTSTLPFKYYPEEILKFREDFIMTKEFASSSDWKGTMYAMAFPKRIQTSENDTDEGSDSINIVAAYLAALEHYQNLTPNFNTVGRMNNLVMAYNLSQKILRQNSLSPYAYYLEAVIMKEYRNIIIDNNRQDYRIFPEYGDFEGEEINKQYNNKIIMSLLHAAFFLTPTAFRELGNIRSKVDDDDENNMFAIRYMDRANIFVNQFLTKGAEEYYVKGAMLNDAYCYSWLASKQNKRATSKQDYVMTFLLYKRCIDLTFEPHACTVVARCLLGKDKKQGMNNAAMQLYPDEETRYKTAFIYLLRTITTDNTKSKLALMNASEMILDFYVDESNRNKYFDEKYIQEQGLSNFKTLKDLCIVNMIKGVLKEKRGRENREEVDEKTLQHFAMCIMKKENRQDAERLIKERYRFGQDEILEYIKNLSNTNFQ